MVGPRVKQLFGRRRQREERSDERLLLAGQHYCDCGFGRETRLDVLTTKLIERYQGQN